MNFKKSDLITLPNILTYVRLLCVPLFIVFALNDFASYHIMIAFGIFVFASVTDIVDGILARKLGLGTDIGKLLDPLADKLLQVSALVSLTLLGHVHWIFTVIIFVKETYMVIGASVMYNVIKYKFSVQSNVMGKMSTIFISSGLILSFFHIDKLNFLFYIDWVILGIGCALSTVSAVIYTVICVRKYKNLIGENKVEQEGIKHGKIAVLHVKSKKGTNKGAENV